MNHTKEKMLMPVNNNVFYRIKKFFKRLFHKPLKQQEPLIETPREKNFGDLEREEAVLELHEKYSKGEIKEEELTEEQMDALCELYDKQIEYLLKSNAERKQKIMAQLEHKNPTQP